VADTVLFDYMTFRFTFTFTSLINCGFVLVLTPFSRKREKGWGVKACFDGRSDADKGNGRL